MKMLEYRLLVTGGALAAITLALSASVGAQPATAAKPSADGGAAAPASAPAASSAAPAAATAPKGGDGGAAETVAAAAPVGDGGAVAAAAVDDAGAPAAPAALPPATLAEPRKVVPPPPPPTPQQVAALNAMRTQADAYDVGARDYRDTVTTVIKLHYEAKKKEILAGLDHEIGAEKEELKKARENAIKSLEAFVAVYTGPRAQAEATPDAMYRLAALYEEKSRSEDSNDALEVALKPAITLYKRIINEFPNYRELAGVFYFLGHAYNDSGRTDEAQQVWRSLVCHNKYKYPTPPNPKNPELDTVLPMPQDHDTAYWRRWRAQHYDYMTYAKRGGEDITYIDPFTNSCEPIPQPSVKFGEEPKYIGEVWWQIGNWEFDQLDMGSGAVPDELASVYGYNRAASAYLHAMKFKKPPLFGVALYKYAWTLFKQQRYEAATHEFVHLLEYTDEQARLTGDPGADFRSEAFTYISGSLTNVDFQGPGPDEPFIPRPDILETEPRPEVVEKKLHVAIDRVKDPAVIPQDKPWTIDVYKSLGEEYRSLNQYVNAVEVYDLILKKWPMHPSAPEVQAAVAETYDQMNMPKKPGTPEHDAIAAKALEARTALANYIGNTPWVDANKDNVAAIQNAERLVKGGLRQAAAEHTNNGKSALIAASETGDAGRQAELLGRSLAEYKLAGIGWDGYLRQDENAPDAYESRYWLADARRQQIRIQVVLHKLQRDRYPEPSRSEIDLALAAAIDVRESNEDDKYLDNASFFVVDISDVDRDLAYQRFEEHGANGVEKREELKFAEDDKGERKPVVEPVPDVVLRSVKARDEYVMRVPEELDLAKHGVEYQYYAAEVYFLYGQFDQARARFEPMWKKHCGKDEYGYKAWERLITMSNAVRDLKHSAELAEAEKTHACALNDAQKASAGLIVNPTLQEVAYINAREKFEQARNAQPGPERDKLWREAAGLYEAALAAAPARDEAPEAAMNAAYAYKQVGDFMKAIELYNKFIAEYGSEDRLSKLQKGDPKAKTQPDPKKYAERLGYLNDAYDALGTTYYSFFNYQRAAETYEKVASSERFDEAKRKVASRNAMILYANMGQREKMLAEYKIVLKLNPTAEEKANADYLVADYDHKQWNSQSGDTGANKQTRIAAEASLERFVSANKSTTAASKFVVEASYFVAKMKKSVNDPSYHTWMKNTIANWESFRTRVPGKDGKAEALNPPYADYAAECEYTLLDEEIHDKYETTKHKYEGAVSDVLGLYDDKGNLKKAGKYVLNAQDAEKWDKALERIARTYPSVEWVPATIARQGSIYDTLRTGLYNLTPPALKYFTKEQDNFLKKMEDSGRDDLADKADQIRSAAKEGWRSKKEKELSGSDTLMIRRYATAVALARKYNVRNAAVNKAIARLAYFTDIIGDAKMREYVTGAADPTDKEKKLDYRDGQYMQTRPGLTAVPPPNGVGIMLPAKP